MPAPRHRTKSVRRVFRKTPGGKTVLTYRKNKPNKAKCASCKDVLKGIIRERPYKMAKARKTQKRPERPFGGNLCTKCLRVKIKEEARK